MTDIIQELNDALANRIDNVHESLVQISNGRGAVTSGVGDQLPEMGQMQPGREWIALSLHMRPGHSGGPVVDSEGKLVGINTMITGPDVGFAIPVHIVKAFLKEAIGSKTTASVL